MKNSLKVIWTVILVAVLVYGCTKTTMTSSKPPVSSTPTASKEKVLPSAEKPISLSTGPNADELGEPGTIEYLPEFVYKVSYTDVDKDGNLPDYLGREYLRVDRERQRQQWLESNNPETYVDETPVGACVDFDGNCQQMTEFQCEFGTDGTYMGAGTECNGKEGGPRPSLSMVISGVCCYNGACTPVNGPTECQILAGAHAWSYIYVPGTIVNCFTTQYYCGGLNTVARCNITVCYPESCTSAYFSDTWQVGAWGTNCMAYCLGGCCHGGGLCDEKRQCDCTGSNTWTDNYLDECVYWGTCCWVDSEQKSRCNLSTRCDCNTIYHGTFNAENTACYGRCMWDELDQYGNCTVSYCVTDTTRTECAILQTGACCEYEWVPCAACEQ